MKKKTVSIEVLRTIASFLVIMAHIQLNPILADGCFSWKRICFSSIIGDNVPLFFLISGFYMFNQTNGGNDIFFTYRRKLKNFFLNIYFPSLIIVIATCMAEPWLEGRSPVVLIQWRTLWNYIFNISATCLCGHLWYIGTYIRFIIFFPLLAFICEDKPEKNIVRRTYIVLSALNIIILDIAYLLQSDFIDFSKVVLDNYFLYLFLGNELYLFLHNKNNKPHKSIFFAGISLYIIGNISKTILQYWALRQWGTNIKLWYMGLECFPAYISSCGLFLTFYLLKNINWKLNEVWYFLGKYSFYIYLCHFIVIKKLQTLNIQSTLMQLNKNGIDLIHIGLYYLELGTIVFIFSLLPGIILEKSSHFLINMVKKYYPVFPMFRHK